MKIEYDPKSDALYVRLNEKTILESEQIRPGIILDYDAEGNVSGIEVLSASKFETLPLKKAA